MHTIYQKIQKYIIVFKNNVMFFRIYSYLQKKKIKITNHTVVAVTQNAQNIKNKIT